MNKLLKFLIPLVLLFTLLFSVSSASAAPRIPPTKECLALTAKMLKKLPPYASDRQEKRAIQSLVNAGCIPKNSFSPIDPSPAEECQAYIDSAVEYLTPINAQAASSPRVKTALKRAAKIDKRYDKKMRLEDRRLDRAVQKNNQKAIVKISKRMKVLQKKEANLKRKALLSDPKIFNNYLANFYLVIIDIYVNGCIDSGDYDGFEKNTSTLIRLADA